ncbi:ribosomal protein L7/L12 C-terminal domain-domain-containing protein [Phakopsora pachyrhizi]|uniref:Ribosomal protein L7/L12 C-terminal domain-domain-containing protein n=1 Tax=Phakopsora pachyrhizi TaxID=170000 RepID=A0AAV0AYQ0_PHAPC|nr:ribosomal protein L7/L12 C-terminal domain-domain-containing protein [Phakopsora pachyrhizi]
MYRTVNICCRIGRGSQSRLCSLNNLFFLRTDRISQSRISDSSNYATQIPNASSKSRQPTPPQGSTNDTESEVFSPKIEEIVKSISQLTLLEASDLVKALKSRLNITEVAMPVQAMALPSNQPTDNDTSDSKPDGAEAEKPKEKTAFTLTLTQIDSAQKAKVIKEVKTVMPNMNLVEAKKFVESLPKVLKENGTKDEVEKLKKALESVGATVKLE